MAKSSRRMQVDGKVCAWIEPRGDALEAGFVCLPADVDGRDRSVHRPPATKRCKSKDDAKHWIGQEAEALGFPVEWIGGDD